VRLPLFTIKTGGTKSWFVPHALKFLSGSPCPKTIVEPFAGSAIVGLSLLYEGRCERLVLAEKDEDYLAFWHAALGDPNFSYRVSKFTERVLDLPFEQQQPFVMASLDRMQQDDPGFWILLRSRIGFNGKVRGGYMTEKSRGGILCRWPPTIATRLDLLYSLRNRITIMDDGFEALAAFDRDDSYGFVDPPFTMTENCPGHKIYKEAVIDHPALHRMLATWKGRFQLTYNVSPETQKLVLKSNINQVTVLRDESGKVLATTSAPVVVHCEKGVFYGLLGVNWEFVQMTSGSGAGGSSKKWELVVSKGREKTQLVPFSQIPSFGYPGGKARLAKNIISMLPPVGNRYVEPFVGRGNVYFAVAQRLNYKRFWLNDSQLLFLGSIQAFGGFWPVAETRQDKSVYDEWKAYVERIEGFQKSLKPSDEQFEIYASPGHLLEALLCYSGGTFGGDGRGWGYGFRKSANAKGFEQRVRLAYEIIERTQPRITKLDYREVLSQCGEGDVVYIDGPYRGCDVDAYTDKTLDHREMVEILKTAKFKWVLSEYEHPLYIDAFGEPALRIPVKVSMGRAGGGSKGHKEGVECLWTNFALPVSCLEPLQAA